MLAVLRPRNKLGYSKTAFAEITHIIAVKRSIFPCSQYLIFYRPSPNNESERERFVQSGSHLEIAVSVLGIGDVHHELPVAPGGNRQCSEAMQNR